MNEIKQCFDFDSSFIEPNWDLRNCFIEKNKTATSFCELSKENNKHLTLSILSVLLFQYNQSLIKEKNNLQNRIDRAIELIKNKISTETYQHLKALYDDIDKIEEVWEDYEFDDLLDILKESGE